MSTLITKDALESSGHMIVSKDAYQDLQRQLTITKRALQIGEVEFATLAAAHRDLEIAHQQLQAQYQHLIAKRMVSA